MMERTKQLSPRLLAAAELVRPGAGLADVGTDHAFLPIRLAKEGRIVRAVAGDINEGPVASARRNVAEEGLEDVISIRLCDGLDGIFSHEADDIVIAGMGGELIWQIIERTPWLRDGEKLLILQPMTFAAHLRRMLWETGFQILTERAVREGSRVYTVLSARYDGQKRQVSDADCVLGLLSDSPEDRDYLKRELRHIREKHKGFRHAGDTENAQRYGTVIRVLEKRLEGKG